MTSWTFNVRRSPFARGLRSVVVMKIFFAEDRIVHDGVAECWEGRVVEGGNIRAVLRSGRRQRTGTTFIFESVERAG
jgi:hypothetical protein